MKRISAIVDGTQAPAGPGSFMMLNYIWSDPHPLTERIRENVGMLNGYARVSKAAGNAARPVVSSPEEKQRRFFPCVG